MSTRLLVSLTALAAAAAEAAANPTRSTEPELAAPFGVSRSTFVPWRVAIAAGVGITEFADAGMRDAAGIAGSWEARLIFRTRQRLSFEASYVGSIQDIDSLGLDDDAMLVSHGVGGAVRVNLFVARYQPYVVAGAAWRRYELTNADVNTSSVSDADEVMETPIGVGFSYRFDELIVDARGVYRVVLFDELMAPDAGGHHTRLDNWTASLMAGIEL